MTDDEGQAFFARIEYLEKDNESLRQQLAECKSRETATEWWDFRAIESLRQQLAGATKALNSAKINIASTDKMREFEAIKYRQADEAISTLASEREANAILTQQLAECQAREKVLRDGLQNIVDWGPADDADGNYLYAEETLKSVPSDSTALDTILKQAKREALLEVANEFEQDSNEWISRVATGAKLRKKAKELE